MFRAFSLLLVAGSAYAQYAASDDGRIVYFSNSPLTINYVTQGNRLWTWSDGVIRTVAEGNVYLDTLSYDGQSVLIGFRPDRWQLLRHGSATPVLDITDAAAVSMSRNGRWLAIARTTPSISISRFELTATGLRPAGVLSNTLGVPPPLRPFVSDDGTVNVPCNAGASCAWDGTAVTPLPAFFAPGNSGRFLYYWNNPSTSSSSPQYLQQFDRVNQSTTALPVECSKLTRISYALSGRLDYIWHQSQTSVASTDTSGRRVVYACAGATAIFDTLTGQSTALASDAIWNSTLTRVLARPTATNFTWVAPNPAIPNIARFDNINLTGPLSPYGILTAPGAPDYTLNWGGQTLPWLVGANGYSYAPIPRDAVPGAIDSLSVSSALRPWINTTVQQTVERNSVRTLPLIAADPLVAFIHGDYRGFVTPSSPAKRGDYLHLLFSGINAANVTSGGVLSANVYSARLPVTSTTVSLPIIAIVPTAYDPSITQVTVRVPENAPPFPTGVTSATFSTRLPSANLVVTGYLVY